MSEVTFRISGKTIMDSARSVVLESSFNKGLEFLMESLEAMPFELAKNILEGKAALSGENNAVFYTDDQEVLESEDNLEYINQYNRKYGYLLKNTMNGKTYQFARILDGSAGPEDVYEQNDLHTFVLNLDTALDIISDGKVNSPKDVDGSQTKKAELRLSRYGFYLEKDEVLALIKLGDDIVAIIFEPFNEDTPLFLQIESSPEKLIQKYASEIGLSRLKEDGYLARFGLSVDKVVDQNYLTEEEDVSKNEYVYETGAEERIECSDKHLRLNKAITEQAKGNGGFITFRDERTNEDVVIPKLPLDIWALTQFDFEHDYKMDESREILEEKWQNICSPGMKLPNDNPYHSDWLIGAGFDIDEAYDVFKSKEDLDSAIHEYRTRMLRGELFEEGCVYLVSGQDESIKAHPLSINKDAQFPIFFKIETLDLSIEEFRDRNSTTLFTTEATSDLLPYILVMSKSKSALILSRVGTKTAHILNVTKELGINLFHYTSKEDLKKDYIYKIEKDGVITKVMHMNYIVADVTPLQNATEAGHGKKVSNLAKLNNAGLSVPGGVHILDNFQEATLLDGSLIARSAGVGEGSEKALFSGIFKSIPLKNRNFNATLKEVVDSFNTKEAAEYAKILNVPKPQPGVLLQEFIEADHSAVIKVSGMEMLVTRAQGSCEKIVSGETHFDTDTIDLQTASDPLSILANNIRNILQGDFEAELVNKDDHWYIVQAV